MKHLLMLLVGLFCCGGCLRHNVQGTQRHEHNVRHDNQKIDVIFWRAKRWQREQRHRR